MLLLLLLFSYEPATTRWKTLRAMAAGRRGRRIQDARLGLPPGVGLGGQELHPLLPDQVLLLLLDGRRVLPHVPQPLAPLRADLDVAIVRRRGELDDAPPARDGAVAAHVAEFPKRVALEVKA